MSLKIILLLVKAAGLTVVISGVSIAIGFVIGMAVSAARLSPNPLLSAPARVFVSFFRGVPLLVQLLLIYNLLPVIGVNVPSVVAAVVGLSLCTAAYQAENLRGGFTSVARGLVEAADMAGLSPAQTFVRVRAPIAFRLTLPALVNEAIMILKASSLVSVVGVIELTREAQDLNTSMYEPLKLYAVAGLLYFIINRILAWGGAAAEKRLAWGAAMSFDLALIESRLPQIAGGLGVTLEVWSLGLVGSVALGFAVAVARRSGLRWLDAVLGLYVEIMRGTPLLIQLFLLYFGGPYIGISLDAIPAGLLGLSLYGAAYFSEIFRAGFEAVPRGHVEAAECVGLTHAQTIARILLPEMTMLVLPPSVNMAIILLKETAVLSIITVHELTFTVSSIGTEFYAFVELLTLLALFYWGLVEICGWAGGLAEARLARFRFAQS